MRFAVAGRGDDVSDAMEFAAVGHTARKRPTQNRLTRVQESCFNALRLRPPSRGAAYLVSSVPEEDLKDEALAAEPHVQGRCQCQRVWPHSKLVKPKIRGWQIEKGAERVLKKRSFLSAAETLIWYMLTRSSSFLSGDQEQGQVDTEELEGSQFLKDHSCWQTSLL